MKNHWGTTELHAKHYGIYYFFTVGILFKQIQIFLEVITF